MLLADKAGKPQYKLNLSRLPALGPKSKIDDTTYLGSLLNDSCVTLNPSGRFIHATCPPKLKDKAIYYAEKLLFDTPQVSASAFTSLEISSENVLVAKGADKVAHPIAIGLSMLVVNAAGDVQTFNSWDEYMNNTPGLNQLASDLIGNRITLDTSQGVDFMVITAPYTMKSPQNPIYTNIRENGQIITEVCHVDQNKRKVLSDYPGISGFKSLE